MKINIIGSGSMGKQITSLFMLMGYDVYLWQNSKNLKIENQINLEIEKLKKNLNSNELGNFTLVNNLSNFKNNFTIETIKEDVVLKRKIINSLEYDENIFSNTSSIKLEDIGPNVNGLHFMNPISLKYVELCKKKKYSEEVLDLLISRLQKLSYNIINVKDTPGFLINKLIFKDISYFFYLIEKENFNKNDILNIYKKNIIKNDPIKILNLIGLDTALSILKNLNNYDKSFYIPLCLQKAVSENILGYKNKKLFKL